MTIKEMMSMRVWMLMKVMISMIMMMMMMKV